MSDSPGTLTAADQAHLLNSIRDTTLDLSVVIMERDVEIGELAELNPGSILNFDLAPDSPAQLHVNGKPVATGTVVQSGENFGLKIDHVEG